jgi:hypothetical protein
VEALGSFGKPMGTFGKVDTVDEYSAAVLWDDEDPMALGPAWIKKALA